MLEKKIKAKLVVTLFFMLSVMYKTRHYIKQAHSIKFVHNFFNKIILRLQFKLLKEVKLNNREQQLKEVEQLN